MTHFQPNTCQRLAANLTKGLGLLLILGLLSGCNQIPVQVDYQPGTPFPQFQRYYWQTPSASNQAASIYASELVSARIEQAVEQQLAAHAILRTRDAASADLLVGYTLTVANRVELEPDFAFSGGHFFSHSAFGVSLMHSTPREYRLGELAIDLRHPEDHRLLWRGTAERRLPQFDSPAEHSAFIDATVAAILAKYPPATP